MSNSTNNLLICVDFSEQSRRVVEYVSKFIPPANLSVTLFNVFRKIPYTYWDLEPVERDKAKSMKAGTWEKQQREHLDTYMGDMRTILLRAGFSGDDTFANVHYRSHSIVRDIIDESKKRYQAVVVGRSGRGEVAEWILGSVASRLLGHLGHLPLCIVGGNPDTKKIMVAMDNSHYAETALEFVTSLVKDGDHELLLFNAVRHLNLPPYITDIPSVIDADRELMERSRDTMAGFFEKCLSRLIESGISHSRIKSKIAFGVRSRSEAIIEEAKRSGYGTIVMGRRGISHVEEFVMGRVSEKVTQMARDRAVWIVA